jgi:exodeoxyribonuclease-3
VTSFSPPSLRIATLNIRHGGGAPERLVTVTDALLGLEAEILVVSEFRDGPGGDRLIAALSRNGYDATHPDGGLGKNSLLIAARTSIDRMWAPAARMADPRHLWCVQVNGLSVCGVYMPLNAAKLPYWDALIALAGTSLAPDVFIGDFNTGSNTLDRNPRGARFTGADRIGQLLEAGYVDLWRSRHNGEREYSWFSPGADNGFRLDHAFATNPFARQVSDCFYDQSPRVSGATDHAALIVDIDVVGR